MSMGTSQCPEWCLAHLIELMLLTEMSSVSLKPGEVDSEVNELRSPLLTRWVRNKYVQWPFCQVVAAL